MQNEELRSYYLEDSHLIVAYRGEIFAGMLVTQPKSTYTIEFLDEYFALVEPTCYVAEKLPTKMRLLDTEDTGDNSEVLQQIILGYIQCPFSLLNNPDLLYIPKILH